MNILVTGGAGFIGSHVVDEYLRLGHRVIVVDDLSTGSRENLNPKAKFYEVDIRKEHLADVFRKENIDVVNHHAAQMDVRKSVAEPAYDASINVLGGINLFESARQHGVKKIIFASTGGAVYGEQDYFPADESHPTRPLSPYGITKLVTEKYLFYYQKVHSIDYVVLRYANIYGPRQNPHGEAGVVAIFCSRMIHGKEPVINGDGKQTRDYTYVGDVVKANVAALNDSGSDIFNVGTGIETDVNTLFQHLREYLSPACKEQHGPAQQGEQLRSVISFKKIQDAFGWKPTVDIAEGLRLTAEYFKNKVVPV
ncbi:MAG: NAD-dependent epimerase/dehydratase family protein [Ignavibacteriales bacterium]|nr:NAD-dependent epimerase/dehydratase family protein [Ignavibacteriales bacterium]